MLVVENNTTETNWYVGSELHPLEYAGDVVIAFDPSKSNMAMVLGTPDGTILNTLEFSGNNRKKGPTMDTTLYCEEVTTFLRRYLENAHIYMVGMEQTILKKGMDYYHSNQVLNEVRSNLLSFFLEAYGVKVIEINNWSWKHAVLPEGFRGQFQKGSKLYFQKFMPNSPYCNYFEADMTDCICIYWYMISKHCTNYVLMCNKSEQPFRPYTFAIYPDNGLTDELMQVPYNDAFPIETNVAFYVNRLNKTFVLTVPTKKLPIEMIYGKATQFTEKDIFKNTVKVVACRQCGS